MKCFKMGKLQLLHLPGSSFLKLSKQLGQNENRVWLNCLEGFCLFFFFHLIFKVCINLYF